MTTSFIQSTAAMGTVVTVQAVGAGDGDDEARRAFVARAMTWFREVERCCSRFDPASELRQLCDRPGAATPAGPILFETMRFALALADETGGAFDPTLGARDAVSLDETRRTIAVARPITIDLGAVAKGFAIDMAARELQPLRNFAIDAGGDLYLAGHNAEGGAWSVGIRHPRDPGAFLETIRVTDTAVCTSGDYERGAHILDPHAGAAATGIASVTAIAPLAMVADGLSTAAFILGVERGIELLERHGIDGMIVTADLGRHRTRGRLAVA